jgi:hypothetical protein
LAALCVQDVPARVEMAAATAQEGCSKQAAGCSGMPSTCAHSCAMLRKPQALVCVLQNAATMHRAATHAMLGTHSIQAAMCQTYQVYSRQPFTQR